MYPSMLVSTLQKGGLPVMSTFTRTSRILGQLNHNDKHFQRCYKSCFILPFQSSPLLCNSNKIFLQQTSNKLLHTHERFSFSALTSCRSLSPFYSRNCSQNIELSDEEEKKRQLIILEHSNYLHDGLISFEVLTEMQMRGLLLIPHHRARLNQMIFIDKKNYLRLKPKKPKNEVELVGKDVEFIGRDHTKMEFPRIYGNLCSRHYNDKLVRAIMFGQSLVIDFDYEHLMKPKQMASLATQCRELFNVNKKHFSPFNLHFVNFRQGYFCDIIGNYMLDYESTILNVHTDDYFNHFLKEHLVYLSPDAPIEMETFDHDAVYIIAGYVDKGKNNVHATYDKAIEQEIKMRKFPLDRYLKWQTGGKELNVNTVVSILLDLKETDDWEFALRHVPTRKLHPDKNKRIKRILTDELRQQIGIPRNH